MSKNMTKKGLALGAGIALVASAFGAAPASADASGPITLVPSAGTTFNSILQSGFQTNSLIDPALTGNADHLTYKVVNASEATLTVGLESVGEADTNTVQLGSATELANGATPALDETGVGAVASALATEYIYVVGSDGNITDDGQNNLLTISTTAAVTTTITVQAWLDVDSDGFVDTFESASSIETILDTQHPLFQQLPLLTRLLLELRY